MEKGRGARGEKKSDVKKTIERMRFESFKSLQLSDIQLVPRGKRRRATWDWPTIRRKEGCKGKERRLGKKTEDTDQETWFKSTGR